MGSNIQCSVASEVMIEANKCSQVIQLGILNRVILLSDPLHNQSDEKAQLSGYVNVVIISYIRHTRQHPHPVSFHALSLHPVASHKLHTQHPRPVAFRIHHTQHPHPAFSHRLHSQHPHPDAFR